MGRRFSRLAAASAVALACAATLLTSGCDPEPIFGACEFSASIVKACEEDADATVFNCVVAPLPPDEQTSGTNGHPSCLEKVCASWQGSTPFCTKECVEEGDCPTGSTCQQHLQVSFCVPDSVTGIETPTGGSGGATGTPDAGGGDVAPAADGS